MDHCCDDKAAELAKLHTSQGRVLRIALAINLTMFFIELVAGLTSHSNALLADSLDMLGDAIIYGFSLWVLHRGELWRNRAALAKGLVMTALGLSVVVNAVFKFSAGVIPVAEAMGIVSFLALCANGTTFWILMKHRSDDLNMRSTWLCTRNDIIANIGVLIAGVLVGATQSNLPDLIVALVISAIILRSSLSTIKESLAASRAIDYKLNKSPK